MDPRRDPVFVRDGVVVAMCRTCADLPERAHGRGRSITCVCGDEVELWRSSTAVVDGGVVALCASCAGRGVTRAGDPVGEALAPTHHTKPSRSVGRAVAARTDNSCEPRRWHRAAGFAAAAALVSAAAVVFVYVRTGSGAPMADPNATTGAPALTVVATAIVPINAEGELPPAAMLDDDDAPHPAAPVTVPDDGVAPLAGVILPIHLLNSDRSAKFVIPRDGRVDAAAAETIGEFLGCPQSGRHAPIAPQLLAMLAELAEHFAGHTIEIISAYRATPNEPGTSPHLDARAADLRVIGVPLELVRDHIWANQRAVGLGYYAHSNFLHVDYRPARERIAWTQDHLGAANHYHPPWSLPETDRHTSAQAPEDEPASKHAMENM